MKQDKQPARLYALVSGRVQGVFYRMFVYREARGLGLTGMVRNLADGRVEVVAEGGRPTLERLVEKLKVGPPGAAVRDVTAEWEPAEREFDGFDITYT